MREFFNTAEVKACSDKAEVHPMELFSAWYEDAKQREKTDVSAVCLATATASGVPSNRMVLLKEHSQQGFVFFSHSTSRKGQELEANPRAALCFHWPVLARQVRVEGRVERVSDEEADAYFASRPLQSRIGAWASHQSQPLKDRTELLKRVAYYTAKWVTGEVARPPHWVGFRVVPDVVEFWQDGAYRIHDRQVFYGGDHGWHCVQLNP